MELLNGQQRSCLDALVACLMRPQRREDRFDISYLCPIHGKGLAGNCRKLGQSKYHINPNAIGKPVSLTFKSLVRKC